jgi:polyhydroxyalkanoate synthesis regulator phasin
MADKPHPSTPHPASPHNEVKPASESASVPSGHSAIVASRLVAQRTSEARDAMAEMAERAQVISQEAGTKIAAAMKDVIGTASGIAGFAIESARDLVQFMVRRGQMTQDEADKLMKDAENAHFRRAGSRQSGPTKPEPERPHPKPERMRDAGSREEPKPSTSSVKRASGATAAAKSEAKSAAKRPPAPKKAAAKSATPKKRR